MSSGRILNGFALKGILESDDDIKWIMIDFYKQTLTIDDFCVRVNAFHNLPYFYKEFWGEFEFKLVFEKILGDDEDLEIL